MAINSYFDNNLNYQFAVFIVFSVITENTINTVLLQV